MNGARMPVEKPGLRPLFPAVPVSALIGCFRLAPRRFWVYPSAGLIWGIVMQLKLAVRKLNDGIVVIDCAGRLVFGEETAALRDQVKSIIAKGSRIVLSLADVTYIDSGGLGTLVALYTTAKNADASIKLARLTKRVGDLLQVTKLVTVFDVYDSEEQAVQSFRKGAAA
jgi:anti-sigma B factor antagonist